MREISVFVGTVGRVLIVPRNGVINCSQELLSGSVSVYCEGGKGLQFHSNRGHCSYRASKIARDLPNTTRSEMAALEYLACWCMLPKKGLAIACRHEGVPDKTDLRLEFLPTEPSGGGDG